MEEQTAQPLGGQKYIDADQAQYDDLLSSEWWVAEQKFDGVRCMVHYADGEVTFTQGTGPLKFHAAAQWFDQLSLAFPPGLPDMVVEGELMIEDGTFHAFDLPYLQGLIGPDSPLHERRAALEELGGALGLNVAYQAVSGPEKRALWLAAQDGGREGIVMKHIDGIYRPGERTTDVLKMKITHTIDCAVLQRNEQGATNAVLGLWDGSAWTVIGRSSMIGREHIAIGSIVEVTYLCVRDPENPVLLQPRVVREREDKLLQDCTLQQIDGTFSNKEKIV